MLRLALISLCMALGLFFSNASLAQYSDSNLLTVPAGNKQYQVLRPKVAPTKIDQQEFVKSVNVANTVRVNSFACIEAVFNIVANGTQIIGVLIGVVILVIARNCIKAGTKKQLLFTILAPVIILLALGVPNFVNSIVTAARDADIFS